jgi:hypothetical protein
MLRIKNYLFKLINKLMEDINMRFKKIFLLLLGVTSYFFISCNETPVKDITGKNNEIGPWFFAPDSLINTMLDSIEGGVDAIQLFTKNELGGIAPPGSMEVELSNAKAIYFFSDTAGPVNLVECNNKTLNLSSLPIHYIYSWAENEGPDCNNDLNWKTVIDTETIYDTIPIPNGFSNMSFSTDSLDIESGGTLTWSTTSSGDVAIVIAWTERYLDGEMGWTNTSYYGTIPDNGSFSVTPQVLSDAGVPSTASEVATVAIGLHKWNLKTKLYDSGNKQLVDVAIVINAAQFWVVQD